MHICSWKIVSKEHRHQSTVQWLKSWKVSQAFTSVIVKSEKAINWQKILVWQRSCGMLVRGSLEKAGNIRYCSHACTFSSRREPLLVFQCQSELAYKLLLSDMVFLSCLLFNPPHSSSMHYPSIEFSKFSKLPSSLRDSGNFGKFWKLSCN